MRATGIVFLKEMLENLRDRRVILSALFFGVLLAPLLFAVSMAWVSKQVVENREKALQLPVSGYALAPNLMNFLRENGAEIIEVDLRTDEAVQAVRSGQQELVLFIGTDYVERLRDGEPAPVELIIDTANNRTGTSIDRARRLLDAYGYRLAALRLMVRGIDPAVIAPVDVRMLDVATPAGRSSLVLGMMTYFCLMSMLAGGFYLAVDTTAGERERGSLEPLLALPVNRGSLILGKMLATGAFMSISLLLTLIAFGITLSLVPLEAMGMTASFGPRMIVALFLIMVTFVPLGAGLMTLVASFTRSNREAQSWLSAVMLLPVAPIMFAVISGTKSSLPLMAIPSLSQHLLATAMIRGDGIPKSYLMVSAAASLLAGAVLIWAAMRLYRREAILG